MSFVNKRGYLFIGFATLLFVVLISVVVYQQRATTPPAKSYCNDYACTNFRDGTNWAIRNCQGTSTEGSTYTCTEKGKTGSCGTKSYCCPGTGMLWTTDLSACAGSTSSDCCSCPTPTPVQLTSQCNGPCMNSGNCTGGNVCLFDQGSGWVCRNPACYGTTNCACSSATPTPTVTPTMTLTPTPAQGQMRCGEGCFSTADCQSNLRCLYMDNVRQCRNPVCPDKTNCSC